MTRRILAGLLGAILAITGSVVPAHAEWSIDVYGGASWTETTDLHVRGNDDTGASVNATVFDIGTDTGFTVGIRVGYWLESLPVLGLGFDIFYFSMEVPAQTTTASASFSGEFADRPISVGASGVAQIPRVTLPGLGFSPELRLRWPLLMSASYPKGRLQPYVIGGPAWALTLEGDEVDVVLGGKVAGGVSFMIAGPLALFAEYRYTVFPDFKLTNRQLTYRADIANHHMIGGIALRF